MWQKKLNNYQKKKRRESMLLTKYVFAPQRHLFKEYNIGGSDVNE